MIDPADTYARMKQVVKDGLEEYLQVDGGARRLEVSNVRFEDKTDPTDLAGQAEAKNYRGTWGAKILGDARLVDKASGKTTSEVRGVTLGRLPAPTPRFSYIVDGNEVAIRNQLRLRSGVYTVASKGAEIKTQVNTSKGENFSILYEPARDVWSLSIRKAKQNPMYDVLQIMGVSDDRIRKELGDDALDRLKKKSRAGIANQLYKTLFPLSQYTVAEENIDPAKTVREYFERSTAVSPETTSITLGQPFESATGDLMLAAMKKQLAVAHGKATFDERDSMIFKQVQLLDDHIGHRLRLHMAADRKLGADWRRRAKIRIDKARDARSAVHSLGVDRPIQSFFKTEGDGEGGLVDSSGLNNPITQLDSYNTTTIAGPGGTSSEKITDKARALHTSTLGLIDPVHTPESSMVGAIGHLAYGIKRLKGGETAVASEYVNAKTGERSSLTSTQASQTVIGFPENWDLSGKPRPRQRMVTAIKGNKVQVLPYTEVAFIFPDMRNAFDVTLNSVPWLDSVSGARGVMAAKMMGQAISLKDPEAPLVQVESTDGSTWERTVAQSHLPRSTVAGVVTRVTPDAVFVREGRKTHRIGVYNYFPVGTKASGQMHHSKAIVAVGDHVRAGQTLAESNFTSGGTLALGKNLTVAYLPYKGLNFEDGLVLSQTAATKMTSEHLHRYQLQLDPMVTVRTSAWRTHFPTEWRPAFEKLFDEDGVIKIGSKVNPGEPLVLAMRKRQEENIPQSQRELRNLLTHLYRNSAVVYDQTNPGVVKNVVRGRNFIEVHVFAEHPTQVGDKMAGRYGNKGVVSAIIGDNQMPRGEDGKPIDVLMNPMGVPSRINPAQLLETAVAKVGKPFVVKNFSPTDSVEAVKKYIASHGMSDTETVTDPSTGRKIPGVMVGRQYVMKLEHEAEKKLLTRSIGGYTLDQLPGEGKNSNPQAMDHLTMYGMLAHGARANIKDMVTYKASRNDEFWRAIENRQPLPPPQSKFAYTKFVAMLKQLGVNVKREGDSLRLQPLTDNEVHEMASGEITDISFMRAQDLKPEPGGLFDPAITGGLQGSKWSYFKIAERIPNPTFEDSVKSLLGVTKDQFRKLLRGELGVTDGQIVAGEKAKFVRGAAVEQLLKGVDVKKGIESTYSALQTEKRPDNRSRLYRKLRTYLNLRDMDVSADKAFMVSVVPVMPPIFRPVYTVPTGPTRVSPVNYLYRDAFGLSKQLEQMKQMGVPDTDADARDAYGQLYDAVAAIQGYQDPINRSGKYKGIMAQIRGEKEGGGAKPKEGWFQESLISHPQDVSARGVLVNGPEMHMDQVGIPEEMAWDLYKQFTLVELMNLGMKGPQAKADLKKKTPFARQALERAMTRRPVWINRAPSLHRHSILAFEPKLIAGSQIKMHPFVYKGFNADNDGDTLAVHVPVTPAAVEEARHFFPSQHPFAVNGDLLTAPSMESQWGLWKMTQVGKKVGKAFKTLAEANAAYGRSEISFTDVVTIAGASTTLGRSLVNSILPERLRDPAISLTSKKVRELIVTVAKKDAKALPATLDALKDLGYQAAYETGSTITLSDITPFRKERDAIMARGATRATQQGVVDGYAPAIDEMHKMMEGQDPKNNLVSMLHSGATKKKFSMQQILGAPVLYTDSMSRPVPSAVGKSFSEGLSPSEYWTSLYGARLGVIGRSHSTAKPGALAKDLIHSTIDNVIVKLDCGTVRGVLIPVSGIDALGRFLVKSVGGLSLNEPIDQVALERLRDRKIEQVNVRSPLTCIAGQGTCAKCWGLDENGVLPKIGTNIGIISAHTITEPSTQLSMNAFHTGGVYGATKARTNLFAQVENLLSLKKKMPGKATVAEVGGVVQSIAPSPKGGFDVMVGKHQHYVPPQRSITTEVGKTLKVGDSISDGVKDPREMAKLVGFANAQEQLAEAIRDTFAAGDQVMPRKHFETVVRSAAGNVEVRRDSSGEFLPGQVVNFAQVDARNHARAAAVPLASATGKMLDEKVKGFEHLYGSVLTPDHVKAMKKSRVRTVKAVDDPITFDPTLHGIQWVPQRRENWVAQLAYRGLERAVRQGAAEGWRSNLHGVHPIPGLVFGKELIIKPTEVEQREGAY